MHTTRRIIWHLGIWLVLAFSTLVTGAPAIAACNGMGHPASSMPRVCCRSHPATCACQSAPRDMSYNTARSGSCHKGDCSCAMNPAPERAPSPQAIVVVGFPAILVSTPVIVTPTLILPVLTIADTARSSNSVSRSSSSPRAPPFQG